MNLTDPPELLAASEAGAACVSPPAAADTGPCASPSSDAPDATSPDEGSSMTRQFVTFEIAGEMFAVPMAPVQEIIRVPEVARMPLAPAVLDGLANLRGRVLPIVNLRRLFGLEARALDDATRALVIQIGQPLGFVVDRVASVISVEPGEIESAQTVQSIVQATYLTGVIQRQVAPGERQLLMILNFDLLVSQQLRCQTAAEHAGGPHAGSMGSSASEAAPSTADNADTQGAADELRLVSFTVAGQEYAVHIADVQEIVQVPAAIVGVPQSPGHVMGLISLRQRLLPLVSLRALFDLPAVPTDEHHRIVVISLPDGATVGLVTDTVKEVLSVPRGQADPMPGAMARDVRLQEFDSICRLDSGRRLVSIIAADRLLGLGLVQDAVAAAQSGQATTLTAGNAEASTNTGDTPPETTDMSLTCDSTAPTAADEDMQVVIFRLGAEEFGVPIMSVQEIVRVPETLTRVPNTPAWVEGVINLRGTVLPVIDQRARLGMPLIARQEGQRIMVYTFHGLRTGFIVDSVAEVLRIPRHHIAPAPALSPEQARLITRVAKLENDTRLVMLIDPAQLLGRQEGLAMQALGEQAATHPEAAEAPAVLAA
jgi:purine-binding chemotaxis protein CheW